MVTALCDEAIAVELYQLERYERLGFNRYDALVAISQGIDWHDAANLLNNGCSHEHALKILAP